MKEIATPNAIKQTDLKLSLPMLLEKVVMFTKQRLQIRKMQHTWEMVMSQDITDKMNAERKGDKYRQMSAFEFNTIERRMVEQRANLERNFGKYKLDHVLVAEQDLRKRMLLLAQCFPTLQIALREGCCEPRIEASVEDVRVLWEKELAGRYASKCVHLAQQNTAPPPTAEAFVFTAPGTLREIVSQQNTAMKDLAEQVARQSIALKELQAKMDAQAYGVCGIKDEVALQKNDLMRYQDQIVFLADKITAKEGKIPAKEGKMILCIPRIVPLELVRSPRFGEIQKAPMMPYP